jgi:hypothetical protein
MTSNGSKAVSESAPRRPRMEPPTQGCGAIYLVSEVEAYIERAEWCIARLEAEAREAENHLAAAEFRGWNSALEAAAEIASNVGPFSSPGMIRELAVDATYRGLS